VSPRRRTLGAHLAWLVTLSTALGLLVFTAVAAFVVWLDERGDSDVLGEIVEDIGLAVVVATPLGLLVAFGGARWAARRVTARIDALVAGASRMSHEDLHERLPVSGRGDELDDLAGALNALFERIDRGIAGLRQFAADASHELRTPLTVMINSLEVARRRPREPAEWDGIAAAALDELRHLADMVEALLQSARAGAFDQAAEPVDVDAELGTIAGRWRGAGGDAGVTIEVAAASGTAARIDPHGLGIAVGNLVGNAIAHSPRGGTVMLRAARAGGRVAIDVDDRGPGIAAGDRDRIFAPFVRGEGGGAARPPGSGLGLAIARRIVEAYGGSLRAGDAPGGGARFTIELPAV
jgi:signal transduction histidine kinase